MVASLENQDHSPHVADADLLLRLGIVLSIKNRASWHLVRFGVRHGEVQLAGIVPTFYDRQLIAALVRHVAGVFRVHDELAVGDPTIRQQLTDANPAFSDADSKPTVDPPRNPFAHLPAVAESLEDILARQAARAAEM